MKKVLVVAAHPDDEVLGCGGTIAKHVANGDKVHVVFMADGVGSRGGNVDHAAKERESAMHAAAGVLGISSTACLGFPDNRLDSLDFLDIVQRLEEVIQKLEPEVLYTHHYGDLNIDHRITQQAVMTACRPVPGSSVKEIYSFEVLSSTEWQNAGNAPFIANLHVDITDYFEKKREALQAYSFEMRPSPHSRSFENVEQMAKFFGFNVGLQFAERFMIARMVR